MVRLGGRIAIRKNVANACLVLFCPCCRMKEGSTHPAGSSLQCQARPFSIAFSASECRANGESKERMFQANTCNSRRICGLDSAPTPDEWDVPMFFR